MSENGILANIFRMGDQVKRNLRDFAGNPGDYLDNVAHQNNIEWKKDPVERSMGFFNPVPLGNVSPFMLRKQMKEAIDEIPSLSRRDFMKKSGGIAAGTAAASIPGAKLLQKFAPEERTLAKEANVAKQAAVEAAPKYKYNSLKEYLDDAKMWAKEDFKAADLSGQGARYSKDEFLKRQLLADEAKYNAASKNGKQKWTTDESTGIPRTRNSYTTIKAEDGTEHIYDTVSGRILNPVEDHLNSFSPQAKKEMKELKSYAKDQYDGTWIDVIQNESDTILPYILNQTP